MQEQAQTGNPAKQKMKSIITSPLS